MKVLTAGFLITFSLAACGSSSSTTSSQSSTRSASPSATAPASNAPSASVAASCQFTGAVQPQGSYTGHTVDSVVLTNTGALDCSLNGYPQVLLKDGSGQAVASISQVNGQGQAATATPSAVNVAPGGTASFITEFSDISSGGSCPAIAGADVTLPGGSHLSVSFGSGFMPCPPSFNVGAVTG